MQQPPAQGSRPARFAILGQLGQHAGGKFGHQRRQQHGHLPGGLQHRIEIGGHLGLLVCLLDQLPGGLVVEKTVGGDRQLQGSLGGGPQIQPLPGLLRQFLGL